ncbi:2-oxoacid:acceptor oxidoreductase family protein [Phorcysia thermohydrogeniphila]|uniref:Indolepyruvate ferredoxin oxidoreductase beta subunit n=1 Tax=Phorcysia thermohydrogeniphila TaxID=936138 RepID=A0A4R1GLX4_9BACT|nr:2-oxoacid:acceptor oxidoreductase family protein [Phorcysia thermohydrogeniphila]TCK05432.1 indolepyruvate ferredoxin oxidoreductase beta subunit [Phorcysia thermohydrogeniphila]
MRYQIVLTGVGGQGTIFLVKLLAQCALNKGIDFIGTETHGMAQKGGTVISYLKIGNFRAPLVGEGQADLLLGLYPTETLRFLSYLKPNGYIVTNIEDAFPKIEGFKLFTVNASELAVKGEINPKSLNVFILGYALKVVEGFPFSKEELEKAIVELNPKFADANIDALNKGYSVASRL